MITGRAMGGIGAMMIVAGLCGPASADVLTLHPVKDATLYEGGLTAPLANGAGEYFFVGRNGTGTGSVRHRAVMGFDVSAIPPGSFIRSATLRLYMWEGSIEQEMRVWRMTAAWGEGASDAPGDELQGAPAVAPDATWRYSRYPSNVWSAQGGDYVCCGATQMMIGAAGYYTFESTQMTTDVQGWVNVPSFNHGWLFNVPEGISTHALTRWATRESPVLEYRPVLTVDYGLPCPIDYVRDGEVDFLDYLEFLNRYDRQDLSADLDHDGSVDFLDYLEFLNYFDGGC